MNMDPVDEQEPFIAQVIGRFGLAPNLFRPIPGGDGIARDLWSFARSAYLDNSLPSLFKERLFVYLSRFCAARYPLVRHAGFLIGKGRPAGDPTAMPHTVEELGLLLNRPLPDPELLAAALQRLEGLSAFAAIPDPGTPGESNLFDVLTLLFAEPAASNRIRLAINRIFGPPAYEWISFLLAYIRTEHHWAESHPELIIEPDMTALLDTNKRLAGWLLGPAGPSGARPGFDGQDATFQKLIPGFTEIENAEKTFLQSGERFKVLIDAIPQVIWANDGHGRANYFNRRWYDFTGLGFEESAGLGWQAIVHPDDALNSIKKWNDAMQRKKEFATEYRLRRADGVYCWFIGRNVPLLDPENRVLGWFGTATDIEDLKKAEASLRESRERLRITVESASDYAIITLDVLGNITSWSKGAEFTFGYDEAEVIGKYCDIIFTPEDRQSGAPEKEITQAAAEGRALDERWHLRKDGSRFYMSGVMAPIIGDTGLQGFVKVARDLTQRKLMEQMKDEFIGIASHELKTPVTNIKGYAQILQSRSAAAGNDEDEVIVQRLNSQVGRLTTLIENLLDTTKVSEGKLALYPELFQLNDLIRERIDELQRLASHHQLVFHPGDIQPLTADKERIGQVLTNLLSNAIKYSPAGGEVTVITEALGDNLRLQVIDRGIGIPEAAKEKVFDRFFRVNSPQMHSFQGMGLGLYISAGIVRRHNGSIAVESTEGVGSVFSVILPYVS
jgi:PAS domain S-box-containing protein